MINTHDLLSAMVAKWPRFKAHAQQARLWRCKERFVGVWAGRGSGKTAIAKRKLVLSLFTPVNHDKAPRYFYGAPTAQQAKRIAWDDLLDLIPKELRLEPNRTDMVITTVFGSSVTVVGMDKPHRIEGVQWDGGVLDESCDIKPGTFDLNVLPTLAWRKGWCWRVGVPKRTGVGAVEFRKFCMDASEGLLDYSTAFNWPSSEVVPPELLIYARKHLTTKDYAEQFDAQFQTTGGGIFYAFDRDYNCRPCTYHAKRKLIIGSDFNVDPMCWIIGHRWPDRFEIIDELFVRNTNTESTLAVLHQRYKDHRGGFEFYGDATGAARKTSASVSDYQQLLNHKRMQELGRSVHYSRSNPPIADRFAACNAMLCNADEERRLYVDPRCEHLIEDLEARTYKPGTREPADVGDIGHMTDAMGYVVHRLFPIRLDVCLQKATIITTTGVQ